MDWTNYILGDVIIAGIFLTIGFIIGKVGFSKIESDIATIKGLISGQQKVILAPIGAANTVQA